MGEVCPKGRAGYLVDKHEKKVETNRTEQTVR
jgi:hypothetical protein